MNKKIYKENIIRIVKALSDINYQRGVWLNTNNPAGLADSFVEAANMLFDDCVVGDYLQEGEILFDKATTTAFHELKAAVDAVNEYGPDGKYRPEEEIIDDPLMEIVRQKAAKVLALIAASDGSESTVEILD